MQCVRLLIGVRARGQSPGSEPGVRARGQSPGTEAGSFSRMIIIPALAPPPAHPA